MHIKPTYVFLCPKSLCSPQSLLWSLENGARFNCLAGRDDSKETLVFTVNNHASALTCGIISGSWLGWGYAVAACGLTLRWVLPVGRFATWSWKLCDKVTNVLKGDVQGASTVDVLLVDGGLDGLSVRWNSCPAKVVLSMGSPIGHLCRI